MSQRANATDGEAGDDVATNPTPAPPLPRHGRLPWPAPDDLDPQARTVHEAIAGGPRAAGPRLFALTSDEGRLEGPFNAMLSAPEVGLALQDLGAAIRYRTALSDRCREIAILLVAADARSDYEWYAHEAVGRHIGLLDDELAALMAGEGAATFDGAEQAVVRLTRSILDDTPLDDAEHAVVEAALGAQQITEVAVLVGYYRTLDHLMRIWRAPLPAGVSAPFADRSAHGAAASDGERGTKS